MSKNKLFARDRLTKLPNPNEWKSSVIDGTATQPGKTPVVGFPPKLSSNTWRSLDKMRQAQRLLYSPVGGITRLFRPRKAWSKEATSRQLARPNTSAVGFETALAVKQALDGSLS
jgi:hypothetical protein